MTRQRSAQGVPLVFFEHCADRRAAQRGDLVEHVRRLDSISSELIASDADPQHGQARQSGF